MAMEAIVILCVLVICVVLILVIKTSKKKPNQKSRRKKPQNKPSSLQASPSNVSELATNSIEILANDDNLSIPSFYSDLQVTIDTKAPPDVINKIVTSIKEPNPLLLPLTKTTLQAQELYKLIKTDPQMSALILKEVNAPIFCLDTPITSVNHAINYLGASKVKSIVIQCCTQTKTYESHKQSLVCSRLWSISHIASSIALVLAKQMGEDDPAQIATDSLLAYLGDHAILAALPETADIYLNNDLSVAAKIYQIQKNHSVNSAMIGRELASHWGLPKSIVNKVSKGLLLLASAESHLALSQEQQTQNLICYISCRLAEGIVIKRVDTIEQLLPLNNTSILGLEFINIQQVLNSNKKAQVNKVVCNPNFTKQINEIIQRWKNA